MTRIYTLVNQKGGVGKTTSAINLGAYLAYYGQRVLLVDLDPQANATSSLGIDKRNVKTGTYEVLIGAHPISPNIILHNPRLKLSLLPSSPALAGAEVELSLLFADVRGSTELAEKLPPIEFKQLIQRFYKVTTDVLIGHNAMINRLMGDQVIGLFVPRFAGHEHAKIAIHAALEILRATGHQDPGGPWVPAGIGVHTGLVYVGAVGTKGGVNEIAVLGNAANLAARLASSAATGEVIVSGAAAAQAVLGASVQDSLGSSENKTLNLKGMSEPISVRVLRVGPE